MPSSLSPALRDLALRCLELDPGLILALLRHTLALGLLVAAAAILAQALG